MFHFSSFNFENKYANFIFAIYLVLFTNFENKATSIHPK